MVLNEEGKAKSIMKKMAKDESEVRVVKITNKAQEDPQEIEFESDDEDQEKGGYCGERS